MRSAAVVAVTALLAPLGLATVGATVAATVTASPAAAAPRPIVVSGDAGSRNLVGPGAWTWAGGNDFKQLKDIITNAANFGPGNTGGRAATFDITTKPSISTINASTLAGVDVFFASGVGGSGPDFGYTPAEEAALRTWVAAGGVLIANTNSSMHDVTRAYLGNDSVRYPPAVWESTVTSNDHECTDITPTHDCAAGTPYIVAGVNYSTTTDSPPYSGFSAPAAAHIAGSAPAPLADGPFGSVEGAGGVRLWHTITSFWDTLLFPPGTQVVATLTTPCTPSTSPACKDQAADPSYDNNIVEDVRHVAGAQPVIAAIPFGTTSIGAGAVIMTSDSDIFANHYGAMQPGNEILAKNMFAWIGQHFLDVFGPPEGEAQTFTAMATPQRVLDTRKGIGGPADKLDGGEQRDFQVAGVLGVPNDATAVALNVTTTNQEAPSFLSIWPAGQGNTNTSNLNFPANTDIANSAIVKLGSFGALTMYTESGATDVIADVVGYWKPGSGSFLNSQSPVRIVDSRVGLGGPAAPIAQGATRNVVVAGQGGVPGNATAVVLNVTATQGTTGGFFTVFPGGSTQPSTSNLNFAAGQNIPNLVVMGLGANGSVDIFNAIGDTDVLVDVLGYFLPSGTGSIRPLTPARQLDTRLAIGIATTSPVGPNGVVTLDVTDRSDNPLASQVPLTAKTVVLNVTAAAAQGQGYLAVGPTAPAPDTFSNLNFMKDQTIPNLVVARVGSDGNVRILNVSAGTHILADVVAWFD